MFVGFPTTLFFFHFRHLGSCQVLIYFVSFGLHNPTITFPSFPVTRMTTKTTSTTTKTAKTTTATTRATIGLAGLHVHMRNLVNSSGSKSNYSCNLANFDRGDGNTSKARSRDRESSNTSLFSKFPGNCSCSYLIFR